jgi:CheY-like chemotaxis protein
MPKPVRQGVLYGFLTQLHADYRDGTEDDVDDAPQQKPVLEAEDTLPKPNDDEKPHSLDMCADANSVVSGLETETPPFKVLVAEDSRPNQMALKRMVSKHGAVVTVVADGSEAVDLVVKQGARFNLALFDLNMPIMGGVEALRLIRQASIDMPIIAISACIDDAQLQSLTDEGFSMVTTKPLRVTTCRELLAKYGHVMPLNPSGEHQPAIESLRGASSTRTTVWGDNVSYVASAVAACEAAVAATTATTAPAIVDLSARTPATAALAVPVHPVPRESWAKGRQPCVLIVMHNTTERLLLKAVCQLEGCVVHTSETGLKALQTLMANEGTYALCLIDTVLSDVEPHSLCSQILELVRGGAGCCKADREHSTIEG